MKRIPLAACAVALTVSGLVPFGLSPAAAETASAGRAQGYGANASVADTSLIDRAGLAEITLPPGGIAGPEELLLVPAAPILVSGTATGLAAASAESTLTTTLSEQTQQTVPGPYNIVGVGLVEGLRVASGDPAPVPPLPDVSVSLVSADALRAEAAGVCRAGRAEYTANSEILNLEVGGTPVLPTSDVDALIDTVTELLGPLASVIEIDRNVVTRTADGIAVDALRVRVLGGLEGTTPLLDSVFGHAEVSGLQCAPRPQCSDTMDNDGDGKIDAQDPGCINNGVYDPNDNDERDELPRTTAVPQAELPRTGADLTATAPIAVGLSVLALVALALRRRSQV